MSPSWSPVFRIIIAVRQTGQMDASFRLARAFEDGERVIELTAANPDAGVPNCPDWDGRALASHMARVWHMLSVIVEHGLDSFPGREMFPEKVVGGEFDAARTALERVDAHMRVLEPGAPHWSWATTQTTDYHIRRLHLENLVHRIDAEQMAGVASEIDGDEAADAVDERLIEFAPLRAGRPAGSLHVHRTDGAGEWTIKVDGDVIVATREHAKGDAAVRGTGVDLMLAVWGRGTLEPLETFGDPALVTEWFELTR